MKGLRSKFVKSNGGFSLVELLVTVAILSLVTLAIGTAMVTSAKQYSRGNVEVDLQQQSQITANLISNLVLDATTVNFIGGNLEIKQQIAGADAVYTIKKVGDTLVYSVVGTSIYGEEDNQLLAENVSAFDVNTDDFDTTKNISVVLGFELGDQNFNTTYNMTARNGQGDKTTALVAIRDVVLEPGEEFTFTSVANRGLTWGTPDGSDTAWVTSPGTSNTATIKVGMNEDQEVVHFTVSAIALNAEDVVPAPVTVNVYVRRVAVLKLNCPDDYGIYDADTEFTIYPSFSDPANKNLCLKQNAERGAYDYRAFEDVSFSIITGSDKCTVVENVGELDDSNLDQRQCHFKIKLTSKLNPGDKIVIEGKAKRPSHISDPEAKQYGKIGANSEEVTARITIEKKTDIRRGWYNDFQKSPYELNLEGGGKYYLLRIGPAGVTDVNVAFSDKANGWFTDNGEDSPSHYRFQETAFAGLDPTQKYVIQFAYTYANAAEKPQFDGSLTKRIERIAGYSSDEWDKYVQTYIIDRASFEFKSVATDYWTPYWHTVRDESVSGQKSIGQSTPGGGYKIGKVKLNNTRFYVETLAHSAKYFQEHMVCTITIRNSSGAVTHTYNTSQSINFWYWEITDAEKTGVIKLRSIDSLMLTWHLGDQIEFAFDWDDSVKTTDPDSHLDDGSGIGKINLYIDSIV